MAYRMSPAAALGLEVSGNASDVDEAGTSIRLQAPVRF